MTILEAIKTAADKYGYAVAGKPAHCELTKGRDRIFVEVKPAGSWEIREGGERHKVIVRGNTLLMAGIQKVLESRI